MKRVNLETFFEKKDIDSNGQQKNRECWDKFKILAFF